MNRRDFGLWFVLAILALPGCMTVRMPQLLAGCQRDLRAESRMYEFHDPFPHETAGPDTVTRPLAFVEPRSDTRRDFDLRMLLSLSRTETGGPLVSSRPFAGHPLVSPIAPAVPIQSSAPRLR